MGKKIIIAVIVLIAAIGISYLLFSQVRQAVTVIAPPSPAKLANGTVKFDQTLPKTEACPLNGTMYSSQQRQWWEAHEPLGVMIENHVDARPQSGLSYSDVVYEAVAEGGITRFLSLFYCQDAPEIGPIRSARVYFIDFLREYGKYPLYGHVGGANESGTADALGQLSDLGWTGYNDLNQFSIGFPTYWRDYDRLGHTVATEHTMYSTTGKLWDFAKTDRGITNKYKDGSSWDTTFIPYTFKEDAPVTQLPASQSVHLEFWTSDSNYFVDWIYDPKNNEYKRNNGGITHVDRDTNKQLTTKNLIVLFMQEMHANDGYQDNVHLLYQDKGTGKAAVFMDGKEIQAIWKKSGPTGRTILIDAATGREISYDRGRIWFSILPLTGTLTVK